ncbi:hypothetical protein [Thermoanaerobacterium aotearoense]|uniref:Uncharacterized protein n=3 Tax=Thermoanaerobacterium TaxID=28895 RepID=W9ECV4_9THEO|nr:hypothetical protein [Thermoanaerobacterium aotearoense]AFK87669.1 hypothetical protein Tsac_2673 [Thermoanaerobacterium saccharolyticum JW/SL-YS485]ETO37604.1 hypothetical protein V518_2296 [Thermoanaerobacterium aotearoense SCUT27]
MIDDLMKETVEESLKYIPKLIVGIDKVINYIDDGMYVEANNLLVSVIDGLNWSVQAITLTMPLHGYKLDMEKVNESLKTLMSGIENLDYQLISDSLNYEIKDILSGYINYCRKGELN